MLSVIIVNYHSLEDIANCLKSAFQFESAMEMEWLIINNDIQETKSAEITEKYPSVKWIDLGYNGGFARANNKGIQKSLGDTVLLLNPDTIILDDAISKCYSQLTQSNNIAASVQLLNPDHTLQISGNFIIKGGLNHLLPLPYLGSFLRAIAFALKVKKTHTLETIKEEKVDWINGAFLMVKKSAIAKAGLLDEDFFLYAEEGEWCSRLKKTGDLCIYGKLTTIHLQGESINRVTQNTEKGYSNLTGKKGLQLIVSQHLRIRKEFGEGWFLFHLFMHTIEIPIFLIASFFDNLIHLKNPFQDWNQVGSFSNNVIRLWCLSPKILKNRPYFYKML
jgi:hypothetical protein